MKNVRCRLAAVTFLLLAWSTSDAQSDASKIEVGAQYTSINFHNHFGNSEGVRQGFGGRLTYDWSRNVAVEAILNFFPGDVSQIVVPSSILPKPRLLGLFGLKAGIRKDRFGVFVAVHPGFMRFTPVTDCRTTDFSSCRDVLKNEFAIDAGGVAEAYLSPHVTLRFDIGDAYLRYGDTRFLEADTGLSGPVVGVFTRPGFQTHNLQVSIGMGFRF
ncbi:MAG TPA: outer membrane beta-barrel protein [Blastocatellia bacterium]|nr:outer membrane beta-barrel protein [Blastocatellia bacterium]